MSQPKPILIISDSPDRAGGLSRITRDIAGLLSRSPKFRVATLGREAIGSIHLPFQQYSMRMLAGDAQWGAADLKRVWEDFAGKERGVVLTIYDLTRTLWLSRPEFSGDNELTQWLNQDHFDLWGYITLDATGPQNKLSRIPSECLLGYKRLLAYTKWGADVIERSIGTQAAQQRRLDWLPHGLDLARWPLRDRAEAKARMYPFLHEGDTLVGAIGTNQPRKDWGLVASTCQQLVSRNPRVRFWWHSDLEQRHWSIPALLADFGLERNTIVTYELSQDELSWRYNACDLTLHPGLGEGFGYPIFESLASGTPVLHGNYAGGADVLRQCGWSRSLIEPIGLRVDGLSNQIRPVYDPTDWAARFEEAASYGNNREALRASVAHLDWVNLWALWLKWFEDGL